MLRITPNTTPAGAKSYYTTADYYIEGQELAGVWRGDAAKRLGLSGKVERSDWDALCDNLNPATGETLTPRDGPTGASATTSTSMCPRACHCSTASRRMSGYWMLSGLRWMRPCRTWKPRCRPVCGRTGATRTGRPATWCGASSSISRHGRWTACQTRICTRTASCSTPPGTAKNRAGRRGSSRGSSGTLPTSRRCSIRDWRGGSKNSDFPPSAHGRAGKSPVFRMRPLSGSRGARPSSKMRPAKRASQIRTPGASLGRRPASARPRISRWASCETSGVPG
ncbi:MAG: relaxase domain-containing protein [Phycisphaeraceae bacterium]|nr:relaxase domain-containing protein [Phycisphaeraceae bacterium]